MTIKSGFYDSINGDRPYSAEELSSIFDGILQDGIFETYGGAFLVSQSTGLTVQVASGRAWFDHIWVHNDYPVLVTLDAAEVVLDRIDAVVLKIDKSVGVRSASLSVVKGTPAEIPNRPTIPQTEFVKQYPLCYIYVVENAVSIWNANISNVVGTVEAPFVLGAVSALDASDLLTQFEDQFNTWFDVLVNQLTENQAANLQLQINDRVKYTDEATPEQVDAGLAQDKYISPKALRDATSIPSGVPGNIGNVLTSNGNIWQSLPPSGWVGLTDIPVAVTQGPYDTKFETDQDISDLVKPGYRFRCYEPFNLSALFPMDANANTTVGGFISTPIGSPTYVAGKFENALTLNGVDQCIQITDNAALKPAQEFTFGCWFKTPNGTGTIYQSASETGSAIGGFILSISTNRLSLKIGTYAGATQNVDYVTISGRQTFNVADNTWHHVVLTFKYGLVQIYLDGRLEALGYAPTPTYRTTSYVRIGAKCLTGTNSTFFQGQLDDIFYHSSYAISEENARDIYLRGIPMVESINILVQGIITDVSNYSLAGKTTFTVFTGQGGRIVSDIVAPLYSAEKSPAGFNSSAHNWTWFYRSMVLASQTSPVANAAYSLVAVPLASIPTKGIFVLKATGRVYATRATDGNLNVAVGISNSGSSLTIVDPRSDLLVLGQNRFIDTSFTIENQSYRISEPTNMFVAVSTTYSADGSVALYNSKQPLLITLTPTTL